MSSLLLTFYDDLEAMTVSYTDKSGGTVTATALNIDERTDSIQTAHLPCRIITSTQADSAVILKGAGSTATWNITDLFLLATVAQDMGTFVVQPVLKRYEVAYLEALQKQWNLVHGWSTETLVLNVTMQAGKYEYPAGSGTFFYGVKCDIVLEEIV
jgi:hypothetical protein